VKRGRLLAAALLCHATLAAAAAITLRDDAGRTVHLEAPARRVITLAPFLTELAYEVGAGSRLVAVSEHSDWPAQARALPQVGNAFDFSLERIAALHPDLVLVWKDSVRASDIERIEGFGARVYVLAARTLAEVPRALEVVAELTGGDARPVASRYRDTLAHLRARYGARRRLSVLLEIWHEPLTTVAGDHFMNEALELCGARNAFADLPGVAPVVPWEEVYRRDPDVIVGVSEVLTPERFRAYWRARPTLSAVKSGRLVLLPPDRLQRPSGRLAEGVAELCAALDRVR
jgi:iron complex transport system substrate-binding protein